MSFSPRPRPHTVNLSYTDPDVTDRFEDDTASHAHSSPRRYHPRGDTPLSRRQLSGDEHSSPGRWTASSRRSVAGGEQDDFPHERSNLDKLLDFLDDDDAAADAHLEHAHPAQRSYATSTPPPLPTHSPRPPPTAATVRHGSHLPRSPLPSHSSTSSAPSDSPSQRAHHRSQSSFARSSSALAAAALLNRTQAGSGAREGAPDSPSPRPGSVAAMRSAAERSGMGSFLAGGGEKSRGEATGREGREGDGAGYAEGDGEAGEEDEEQTEAAGSLDSDARVAQAALEEFDTIISHGLSTSTRSASRLRNIPSPARTPTPPFPPSQPRNASSSLSGNDEINAQVVCVQLVQELRDAQEYIAYLQDELRSISDVVAQLRERPEDALHDAAPNGVNDHGKREAQSRAPPAEQDEAVLQATNAAAFNVVKHLVALLPSLSLSPTSPSPSSSSLAPGAPPSLSSLALALSFTRDLDQLAHRSPFVRRDEDVFAVGNLERVMGRVKGWERAARGVGRGEGEP
ncbi:hypothetical protein JCM10207_002470 [Rhodosporidiobolus poonsookiae]